MASNDLSCRFCGKPFDKPSQVRSHEQKCRRSPDYKRIDMRSIRTSIGDTQRDVSATKRSRSSYNKNIFTVSMPTTIRNRLDAMTDPRQQITRSSIIRDAIAALGCTSISWDDIEEWDRETPKREMVIVTVNLKHDVQTSRRVWMTNILSSARYVLGNVSAFVRYAVWTYIEHHGS